MSCKEYNVKWFEEIDSTNSEAFRNLATAPERSVWGADFQSAGRGQRGNKWESESSVNLMFSVLYRPDFLQASRQFLICALSALSVRRYLAGKGVETKVKWPNDIYAGDRKICGILIEQTISGDKMSASVIGPGINLNQKTFPDNLPNPVSLTLLTGENYHPRNELPLVLEAMEHYYGMIHTPEGAEEMMREYHSALYRLGEFFMYRDMRDNTVFEAKITGVDALGCLVLEDRSGNSRSYAFKEIGYIL